VLSIVNDIIKNVRQPQNRVIDPENYRSYIGQISYCKKMFTSVHECYLPLVPLYESSRWIEDLEYLLSKTPMGREGMTPDACANMEFLRLELDYWTNFSMLSLEEAPWKSYPAMWEGIPNVSECAYSRLMSRKYTELLHKLYKYVDPVTTPEVKVAMNRTFVINFPDASFCPISFGFSFDYQPDILGEFRVVLLVMINFRSLEVSRNILNDLYLFLHFLRRLVHQANPGMTDGIPIVSLTINSMDAHIIDLTK